MKSKEIIRLLSNAGSFLIVLMSLFLFRTYTIPNDWDSVMWWVGVLAMLFIVNPALTYWRKSIRKKITIKRTSKISRLDAIIIGHKNKK